jgi:hypothetical protein
VQLTIKCEASVFMGAYISYYIAFVDDKHELYKEMNSMTKGDEDEATVNLPGRTKRRYIRKPARLDSSESENDSTDVRKIYFPNGSVLYIVKLLLVTTIIVQSCNRRNF